LNEDGAPIEFELHPPEISFHISDSESVDINLIFTAHPYSKAYKRSPFVLSPRKMEGAEGLCSSGASAC
jgi:hypothetical protein